MCEPGTIFLSHLLKTTLLEDLRVVAIMEKTEKGRSSSQKPRPISSLEVTMGVSV